MRLRPLRRHARDVGVAERRAAALRFAIRAAIHWRRSSSESAPTQSFMRWRGMGAYSRAGGVWAARQGRFAGPRDEPRPGESRIFRDAARFRRFGQRHSSGRPSPRSSASPGKGAAAAGPTATTAPRSGRFVGRVEDFVNNAPDDNGYNATNGCTTLFIYYLFSQLGYSINQIVGAGASTLAGVLQEPDRRQHRSFPSL